MARNRRKIAIALFFTMVMVLGGLVALVEGSETSSPTPIYVTPSSSATPAVGGTVYIPIPGGGEPNDNFNPMSPVFFDGIQSYIYEPLYQININNGTELPWLATSYTWHDGDRVLNVTLRHGVTFSNGETFNASDVVFTFNLLKDHPDADLEDVWAYLSSVTSNGPYNVTFDFKEVYTPAFYYIMGDTYMLPEDVWENISHPATYDVKNPIGTGPFMLDSFSPTKIVLERNPHYWQPNEPHIQYLDYVYYTGDTSVEVAMEKGQLTWDAVFIPDLQKDYVSKDPSNYGYFMPESSPLTVYTNNLKWPLNESFMRIAMSEAINRTYIYHTSEYGYMPPAISADMTPGQASEWLNSTTMAKAKLETTFNVTAAISLLNAHGYTIHSNGRLYAPNGTEVPSMTIITPEGYTNWDGDEATVASEMSAIGLKVTAVTPTVATDASYLETGNYWMAYEVSPISGPSPYYTFEGEYDNLGNVTPIGKTATTDYGRWNSSKYGFNALMNDYSTTSNKTLEKKYVNELTAILNQQMPDIPTVYNVEYTEWDNKTIGGFATAKNDYWVGDPELNPDNEVVALHLYEKNVVAPPAVAHTIDYVYAGIGAVVVAAIIAAVGITSKRRKNRNE